VPLRAPHGGTKPGTRRRGGQQCVAWVRERRGAGAGSGCLFRGATGALRPPLHLGPDLRSPTGVFGSKAVRRAVYARRQAHFVGLSLVGSFLSESPRPGVRSTGFSTNVAKKELRTANLVVEKAAELDRDTFGVAVGQGPWPRRLES
jgi:hypothetical protein